MFETHLNQTHSHHAVGGQDRSAVKTRCSPREPPCVRHQGEGGVTLNASQGCMRDEQEVTMIHALGGFVAGEQT